MSLSQKEKAQLQAKRIKHLKYKATGLFLYHPASDSWIPAQCDDEGRLVIDPSDLDTRYYTQTAADILFEELLKLDGSRKMIDKLDFDEDFAIQKDGVDQLTYATTGDLIRLYANLRCDGQALFYSFFFMRGYADATARFYMYTSAVNEKMEFHVFDGDAAYDVPAYFLGRQGVGLSQFAIPMAGNIIPVKDQDQILGSVTRRWKQAYIDTVYGYGNRLYTRHFQPNADSVYDLGSSGERWNSLFVDLVTSDPGVVGQFWRDGAAVKVSI